MKTRANTQNRTKRVRRLFAAAGRGQWSIAHAAVSATIGAEPLETV
jgi:hypothetical protein